MYRRAAISALVRPAPSRRRSSISRLLSWPGAWARFAPPPPGNEGRPRSGRRWRRATRPSRPRQPGPAGPAAPRPAGRGAGRRRGVPPDLVQAAVQADRREGGLAAGQVQGDHGLDGLGEVLVAAQQVPQEAEQVGLAGPLRLDQGHPPPFDRVGLTAQQVLGPGQPAVRHRTVPQAFGVVAGEEDGHMHGRFVQVSSTVGDEGALPGLDRTGDVGQPPPAPGQPVKGCRRLLVGQFGLHGGSSCFPVGRAQRGPSAR